MLFRYLLYKVSSNRVFLTVTGNRSRSLGKLQNSQRLCDPRPLSRSSQVHGHLSRMWQSVRHFRPVLLSIAAATGQKRTTNRGKIACFITHAPKQIFLLKGCSFLNVKLVLSLLVIFNWKLAACVQSFHSIFARKFKSSRCHHLLYVALS